MVFTTNIVPGESHQPAGEKPVVAALLVALTTMDPEEARGFLTSLLNKVFRVTTTDGRTFIGEFKCTDAVGLPLLSDPSSP